MKTIRANKKHQSAMLKYQDLVGKTYGRLVVLSILDTSPIAAHCHCVCGKHTDVPVKSLLCENTKSCGCLRNEANHLPHNHMPALSDNLAAKNRLYRCYRSNALKVGREFSLTKEEFINLTQQPCFYCGSEPTNQLKADWKHNTGGSYVYNGLDRVDNEIGYNPGNVVPCCFFCNRAKGVKSQLEFLEWIGRLIRNQKMR